MNNTTEASSLNSQELKKEIAEEMGITQVEATAFLKAQSKVVRGHLSKVGNRVIIPDVGIITVKEVKARAWKIERNGEIKEGIKPAHLRWKFNEDKDVRIDLGQE